VQSSATLHRSACTCGVALQPTVQRAVCCPSKFESLAHRCLRVLVFWAYLRSAPVRVSRRGVAKLPRCPPSTTARQTRSYTWQRGCLLPCLVRCFAVGAWAHNRRPKPHIHVGPCSDARWAAAHCACCDLERATHAQAFLDGHVCHAARCGCVTQQHVLLRLPNWVLAKSALSAICRCVKALLAFTWVLPSKRRLCKEGTAWASTGKRLR
jgi:hypothetical protein